MLAPRLRYMGQAISKKLTSTENVYARKCWKILNHPWVVRSIIVFLALFYVGIPIWFYLCPWLRRGAVFLHFADWPFQNRSSPASYGLQNTRHFFVESSPSVWLGVWHVTPGSSRRSDVSHPFADDSHPVVLYLHGSAESRSAAYRRSMYRVLSSAPINAHIITFDYRGFGDSSHASPTVQTLEEDAITMFDWLQQYIPPSRIIVWGHSMGSGLAIRLGQKLAEKNETDPFAIVLEAPFISVAAATHTFPLSFFHRRLPFFRTFCSDRTQHPDTNFNNGERIGSVTAPLLILHAADDSMVWSEQGQKLWKIATDSRPKHLQAPVYVELDGKYGCGHRNIHKAPNLPHEVFTFLESVKKYSLQN